MLAVPGLMLIFLGKIFATTLYCPTGKIYSVMSPSDALTAFEEECQCQVAASHATLLWIKQNVTFGRMAYNAALIQAMLRWDAPQ